MKRPGDRKDAQLVQDSPYPQPSQDAGQEFSQIENLIDQASDAIEQATRTKTARSHVRPYHLDKLSRKSTTRTSHQPLAQPIDLLGDVELDLRIELGRTQMTLEEVLQLRGGSVVALDDLVGDPVSVFVNGRIVARGEIVVIDDNFCVRVTELVGA